MFTTYSAYFSKVAQYYNNGFWPQMFDLSHKCQTNNNLTLFTTLNPLTLLQFLLSAEWSYNYPSIFLCITITDAGYSCMSLFCWIPWSEPEIVEGSILLKMKSVQKYCTTESWSTERTSVLAMRISYCTSIQPINFWVSPKLYINFNAWMEYPIMELKCNDSTSHCGILFFPVL